MMSPSYGRSYTYVNADSKKSMYFLTAIWFLQVWNSIKNTPKNILLTTFLYFDRYVNFLNLVSAYLWWFDDENDPSVEFALAPYQRFVISATGRRLGLNFFTKEGQVWAAVLVTLPDPKSILRFNPTGASFEALIAGGDSWHLAVISPRHLSENRCKTRSVSSWINPSKF